MKIASKRLKNNLTRYYKRIVKLGSIKHSGTYTRRGRKVNGTQQRPEIDATPRGNLGYDRDGTPSAREMDHSVNSIGKMASHLKNN